MKKIIAILLLVLCSGCQNHIFQGKTLTITWEQTYEKIQEKESFLLLFTQSGCDSCKKFQVVKNKYLTVYDNTIYEINLTLEEDTKEIQEFFPQLVQTPAFYYIENGKMVSELNKPENKTSEELKLWIIENVKNK